MKPAKTSRRKATQKSWVKTVKGNLVRERSQKKWRQTRGRETNRLRRVKTYRVIVAAKSRPCFDCGGVFDPVCMDFDHRPGEIKRFAVSAIRSRSIESVLAEIAKCDVVCSNCHRIRTFRHRDHRKWSAAKAALSEHESQLGLFEDANLNRKDVGV